MQFGNTGASRHLRAVSTPADAALTTSPTTSPTTDTTTHPGTTPDAAHTPLADQPISAVAELLFEHRASLEARARAIVHDPVEAADVVQEAFMRFMVAAPELATQVQALAYLRTTVTHLAIDLTRAKGRRPALVAIDPTSHDSELERAAAFGTLGTPTAPEDHDDALIRADDAALVRLALSKLTPAQRRALVMREVTGVEIDEIAREFHTTPGNARVLVHRAREAFRRALETTVVDAERGLTAADLLSVSVAKAAKAAKTAGKAALALMLPLLAGLAWWFAGPSTQQNEIALPAPSATDATPPSAPATTANPDSTTSTASTTDTTADASPDTTSTTTDTAARTPASATAMSVDAELVAIDAALASAQRALEQIGAMTADFAADVVWPGTDAAGVPTGVWVSDGRSTGAAAVANVESTITLNGRIHTTSDVFTTSTGAALLLGQTLSVNVLTGEVDYRMDPAVRVNGAWLDLRIANQSIQIERRGNRELLITVWAIPNTRAAAAEYGLAFGSDLASVPAAIGVRIHTTEVGQPIFGQSVVLLDLTAGA